MGTIIYTPEGFLWKLNVIVSLTYWAHSSVHSWLSGNSCTCYFRNRSGRQEVLSVEDIGAYSSPPSLSSPGLSPVSSFPSFFLSLLSLPPFSIPPTTLRGWKKIDLFIWRLNSTLTLRENKPCNTLYYHISATFKQSLLAWAENYHPAVRHKLEGLPVWKRDRQQLAGLCLWEGEAELLALCVDFTWKIALPFSFHRQENNSNLLKCGRAGKQQLID